MSEQFDKGLQIVLAVGILCAVPLIIRQGIALVSSTPQYENFVKVDPNSPDFQKQHEQYTQAVERNERIVFFGMLIGGFVALGIGMFIAIKPVAVGLSAGGILSCLWGTLWFWSGLGDIMRFGALIFFLILLIIFSTRLYRRQ